MKKPFIKKLKLLTPVEFKANEYTRNDLAYVT